MGHRRPALKIQLLLGEMSGVETDSLQFLWEPSTYLNSDTLSDPVCTPFNNQDYTYTVTTAAGCFKSSTLSVIVLKEFSIPNAFSPNGDGINDTWKIKDLNTYPGATVDVYNRYGQPVFHSDGYSKEWDGSFNGSPLPVGTYYYVINPRNNKPILSGSVTILR